MPADLIKIKGGTTEQRLLITPAPRELVYDSDMQMLFIGDGSTVGGHPMVAAGSTEGFASEGSFNLLEGYAVTLRGVALGERTYVGTKYSVTSWSDGVSSLVIPLALASSKILVGDDLILLYPVNVEDDPESYDSDTAVRRVTAVDSATFTIDSLLPNYYSGESEASLTVVCPQLLDFTPGSGLSARKANGAIAIGQSSVASAAAAFASGQGTQALGTAAHSEGTGSIASGKFSHAQNASEARGYMSTSIGQGGRANRNNQFAHGGAGRIFSGGVQYTRTIVSASTTNATATPLLISGPGFSNGSGSTDTARVDFFVAPGKSYACVIHISARSTTGASAMFQRQVLVKEYGGTVSLEGSVSTIGTDINPSSWDVSIAANNTAKTLDIMVTGATSTTIIWIGRIEANEMADLSLNL